MTHQYLPHTDSDIKTMLSRCGATSLEDLYVDVPAELRLKHAYNLPKSMSEIELRRYFEEVASKNRELVCFAGGGFYDHYTPAVIPAIISRSEFSTAYTPYQPEVSQGTLQYIFEYQSMMAELTGLDVSNASMYDGATATAEAMMLAVNAAKRRRKVLISQTISPNVLDVVKTYAHYHDIDLEIIPEYNGITCRKTFEEKIVCGDVAAVIVAAPNYYGIVEDYSGWAELCHNNKALFIMNAQASTLAAIRAPGEWGADVAVGDAQSLGMPLNYGGPYLGYMTVKKELMRKLPGRIVGKTHDASGKRAFVLTLQAREQHIRREKATSNICSNQGLMALHTAVYLSLMGREGMRKVNELSYGGAHYLAEQLVATGKMQITWQEHPYFNEVTMTLTDGLTADTLLAAAAKEGILAGVKLDDKHIIIAVTEMQSRDDINRYVSLVKTL
jgi:glycine dehydrogenase subunit 1